MAISGEGNRICCGHGSDRGSGVSDSELGVGLPGPAEVVGVIAESGTPLTGAAAQSSVIDENKLLAVRNGVVGIGIDLNDLERSDDWRVSGNTVEADIRFSIGDENEEIGVGTGPGKFFRPRRAPAEDQSALDGDVEGRRLRLAVVVVIDGECADVVASGGQIGNYVAILLAGGEREEPEGFLLGVVELERLGDDGGGSAGEEAVGEPGGVEGVGGVSGAATVYVV